MPHLFCLAQKALFLTFAAIFVVGYHSSAQAGPQSLGLVMTDGPVPLTCEDGVCRAVLTSFCLERDRDTPQIGTPYRVGAGEVTLIVRGGPSQHRIPANDLLRFTSQRDSHSVEIRLPRTAARSWQGAALSLDVGRRVTLLPLSGEGGDGRDPLRTAALTGPMREVGEQTVDLAAPDIDALRLLDRAVNRLPETGRGGIERSEAVWHESISSLPGGAAPALAENAYRTCQRKTEDGLYYSFRNCLVVSHESLITRLNERYWDAVGGSQVGARPVGTAKGLGALEQSRHAPIRLPDRPPLVFIKTTDLADPRTRMNFMEQAIDDGAYFEKALTHLNVVRPIQA